MTRGALHHGCRAVRFPWAAFLLILLAPAGFGCASGEGAVRTGPQLDLRQRQLFDNGVDLIADPTGLQGAWLDQWQAELDERLGHADSIVEVEVSAVRTDTDPGRHTSYRIMVRVLRVLKGELEARELSLASLQSDAGFPSVERNGSQLLQRRFVAFLLRGVADDGAGRDHFHLSPPSQATLDRIAQAEGSHIEATTIVREAR
ncbi:MAG: hypothetical protein OEZ06_05840 [Myxococcales bacterium]|nr:hypothetical protein [Myxococcales bacterium]